jgi:hypothetical protein
MVTGTQPVAFLLYGNLPTTQKNFKKQAAEISRFFYQSTGNEL